jgi:hypothetical protein
LVRCVFAKKSCDKAGEYEFTCGYGIRYNRNFLYRRATTVIHWRIFMERIQLINRFRTPLLWLIALTIVIAIIAPVAAAGSLTRGTAFTITIAGKPNTAYYVWFTRTFDLSGEPGDQPPVISGSTEGVEFDPDGGPYAIGSYQYNNGNGRRIIDDVAPASASVSNTRYYAKVTTDSDGVGTVRFSTSSATAERTFSIRAENPATGEEVPVRLNLPEKSVAFVTTTTAITETTLPPTTVTLTLPATVPPADTASTPVPATAVPTTKKQASAGIGIVPAAAAGAGLLAMRRRP